MRVAVELINGSDLGLGQTSVLAEHCRVKLIAIDVALGMHELASLAISTELFLVELFAGFCHEILRQMSLLDKLVLAVGVRALVAPAAVAVHLPVLAHLGLLLFLVLPHERVTFGLINEVLSLFFRVVLSGHFRRAAE